MFRARLIVQEVNITRQGEISFFDIRLPKNVLRIIGIETDVFILSPYVIPLIRTESGMAQGGQSQQGQDSGPPQNGGLGNANQEIREVNYTPVMRWESAINPTVGKVKLRALDRTGIFYEAWISLVLLDAGLPDMSFGIYPKSPYTLNINRPPKKTSYACEYRLIQGMYEDELGKKLDQDMRYTIKVFVWVETWEDNMGIVFDFQEKSQDPAEGGIPLPLKT